MGRSNRHNTIERYYLRYGLYDDVLIPTTPKIRIVYYYIINYPINYLLSYPNFMANKLDRDDLREWIYNNLDIDIISRSKKSIRDFLSLDSISASDIFYTGW